MNVFPFGKISKILSMKSSTAVLTISVILTLTACAGPAAQNADESPPAEQPTSTGPAPIVEVERAETVDVPAPEGCQYLVDEPTVFGVDCGAVNAVLARTEYPPHIERSTEAFIAGVISAWAAAGWILTEDETFTVTYHDTSLELTRLLGMRETERRDVFAGIVFSLDSDHYRATNCSTPSGADPVEAGCLDLIDALQEVAAANRVTSLKVRGEYVELPEGCTVADHLIVCGYHTLTWAEFPSGTPQSHIYAPAESVMEHVESQGMNPAPLDLTCEFAGLPMSCNGAIFRQPELQDQMIFFGYSRVGDVTIRVICESLVLPDPLELPEPCSLFVDAELNLD